MSASSGTTEIPSPPALLAFILPLPYQASIKGTIAFTVSSTHAFNPRYLNPKTSLLLELSNPYPHLSQPPPSSFSPSLLPPSPRPSSHPLTTFSMRSFEKYPATAKTRFPLTSFPWTSKARTWARAASRTSQKMTTGPMGPCGWRRTASRTRRFEVLRWVREGRWRGGGPKRRGGLMVVREMEGWAAAKAKARRSA